MKDLQGMSGDDLLAELKKAEESLDDIREERRMTLGKTEAHIGAARVEYLTREWDREEKQLHDRIELIKRRLLEIG